MEMFCDKVHSCICLPRQTEISCLQGILISGSENSDIKESLFYAFDKHEILTDSIISLKIGLNYL